jgi:ABC-type amino acid transport substrate-binding protein
VVHKADSYGSKSGNGSWNGIIALVICGVADFGVASFYVTKERSEVVSYIDPIGFVR